MANIIADARNKRSQLISQRAAELIRTDSPISSTGSCHGTIVSESTSNFFTDIDEDIANGDIWTPNREAILSSQASKNNDNTDKIRSTAKKHGRWESRRQNEPVLNESAIAAAFPDFTSIGEAMNEQNKRSINRESVPIEIARGHRHAPNIASPRQSNPLHLSPAQVSDSHLNHTRIHLTADRYSKSRIAENSRSTSNASSKLKPGGHKVNYEQKKNTRSSLHKTMHASPYVSNATDASNDELRSNKAFQTRIRDEMDNSFMTDDKPASLTNVSNDDTALLKKSNRFAPRQRISDENSFLNKEKLNINTRETRYKMTDDNTFDTPSKKSKGHAVATKPLVESTTGSGNPTQTTSSFVIPWHNNSRSNISSSTTIPVFTAQGVVKNIRLPHEYIDSIDMPFEEEQLYGMIDNIKDSDSRIKKLLESYKQKSSHTTEEKCYTSARKRSDSGLGSSGSEVLGSSTSVFGTEQINHKNREKEKRTQINYKNNIDTEEENQRLSSLIENLEKKHASLKSVNTELVAENWARSIENKKLIAKIQQLLTEKHQLELNVVSYKEQIEKKDILLKDSHVELANLRREREQDFAVHNKQMEEKITIIKDSRIELANLQRDREQNAAHWDSRTQNYEFEIRNLKKQITELHTKLDRSEKCCKTLKANSEKLMESTLELEVAKKKRSSKISTGHKYKQTQKIVRSKTQPQTEKTDTQLTDTGVLSQDNMGLTLDFEFSDASSGDNTSSTNHTEKNQFDIDSSDNLSSNLSDILGHGYVENMRNRAEHVKNLVKEQKADDTLTDFDETVNSTKYDNTTQSLRSAPVIIISTDASSSNIDLSNQTRNKTIRRSKSVTEKNTTFTSKSSVRRHSISSSRNLISSKEKNYCTKSLTDEDVFKKGKGEKAVVNDQSQFSRHLSHEHNVKNCSICIRAELNNGNKSINPTVRIERPKPVSDRIDIDVPQEEELTMRPSISPGRALAKIIKMNRDEIDHLTKKYLDAQNAYMNHDPTLGRKKRKNLSNSMKTQLVALENKKDQLYSLYDVLEGQKSNRQEMTAEFINLTLTNHGIHFDETWNGCE
ncbi:hypothetical protein GcM1_246040 [Golovinomyces cichoracearum]|uniref:Cep57 centrosome microtubule-binding domain-containing protein n=1 Tax=Golovinomyces cichoracearum TaxID=62708 RepID=A0A420IEA1_9PEZI|nr:hypothetical protein GcM1_246040 [Golovinomyces cichoracearum]